MKQCSSDATIHTAHDQFGVWLMGDVWCEIACIHPSILDIWNNKIDSSVKSEVHMLYTYSSRSQDGKRIAQLSKIKLERRQQVSVKLMETHYVRVQTIHYHFPLSLKASCNLFRKCTSVVHRSSLFMKCSRSFILPFFVTSQLCPARMLASCPFIGATAILTVHKIKF